VFDVLIEIDVGMQRGGVRSVSEAVTLAQHIAGTGGIRFRGVQGYEGHCMLEPDRTVRVEKALRAMEHVMIVVDALAAAGFAADVVSGGGTGTYDITGAHPRVTELQAGSYVFMDAFHGTLVPGFDRSLTVLATCSGRHGQTVVFDAGRKSVGVDFAAPELVGHEHVAPGFFAEEHGLFDFSGAVPFDLGDRARIVPGYAPTTVNLYDVLHVVDGDVVVDVWPIVPRGPGRGLAAAE
jgi:D-serine deaminase-like pyridoxal phosphate-dependent protein